MSIDKKTRAERREERQKKFREKRVGFSDQAKKMKVNKDYEGDVKKLTRITTDN